MSLAEIYMPLPAGTTGRVERLLDPWPEKPLPNPNANAEKRRRYRARNRDRINASQRAARKAMKEAA